MAAPAQAAVYTVNYADDGSRGTLRWAIEQSNSNPGDNLIQIVHVGRPPYVIKLNSLLPPISGPVMIRGMQMPKASIPPVVVDTLANLPAAVRERLPEVGVETPSIAIDGSNFRNLGAAPSGPPFRKLLDAGIPCGGGSDATNVAAFNPWLMMSYMTTAKNNAGLVTNGDQTITRLEALRMYTLGSAYLSFDDAKLGSIEEGKLADLAVLSDDPLTVSDANFKRLQSVLTLQAGRIVHQSL